MKPREEAAYEMVVHAPTALVLLGSASSITLTAYLPMLVLPLLKAVLLETCQ